MLVFSDVKNYLLTYCNLYTSCINSLSDYLEYNNNRFDDNELKIFYPFLL